jgi:hypothetical protein
VRKEVERVAVFLGALAFVNGILSLEVASSTIYLFYILSLVFTFLYLVKDDRRFADLIVLFTFAAAFTAVSVYRVPSQTDEESLVLYAAYLFRHGVNPYAVNLINAYRMFPVAEPVVTATLSPNYYVNVLGYPALYFEIASVVYPQVATLVTTSLLYLFLRWKGKEKLFFIVMLIVGSYMAFTGGTFDIISLAIAIVALTTKGWVRTALMALSGDIKQYTLLYLPFMWKDVGVSPHTPNAKELAKNVVIPFTVFLIPNLPFISLRWAFDVLGPLTQPIANQGTSVSLLTMVGIPIPHIAYTVAFLTLYIALLVLYKPNTKWKWILPAFIWIVSWRDLNYFLFYITIWVSSYELESADSH